MAKIYCFKQSSSTKDEEEAAENATDQNETSMAAVDPIKLIKMFQFGKITTHQHRAKEFIRDHGGSRNLLNGACMGRGSEDTEQLKALCRFFTTLFT